MTDPQDWDHEGIPPPPPRLDQPRNRGNHMFESPRNHDQRCAWAAARWTLNGWTLQEIAEALGITSRGAAHAYVQRGLHSTREATQATAEQARAAHRARLGYALEVATEVMGRDHVHVSQGRVMKGDDGTPLIDDGPKLTAARTIGALSESLRKLDGLDAATKVDTTVTVTPQDVELQERLAQARERVAAEEQALRGDTQA
jgi:hypothetical protein